MELIVFRKYFGEKYTIGRFYADNVLLCDTLEDKVRVLKDLNHDGDFTDPGEGKIMGKTAIPCGRYQVVMQMFQRHNRMTPLLLKVPGFTEIFIHAGTDEGWTAGCVLVGENKLKGKLVNSPYWESHISKLVTDAIANKQEVFLTVKQMDPYKC
jgi:hypothetical protein